MKDESHGDPLGLMPESTVTSDHEMEQYEKFYQFLKREGILQSTGVFFLFVALVTTAAVLFAPFAVSDAARSAYYVRHTALMDWLFILVPSIGLPIMWGIGWTFIAIAKLKRQRREQ